MRIKIGKKYINAKGDIITIVKKNTDYCAHQFIDENSATYTNDGRYGCFFIEKEDLICKIDNSILNLYENNSIDKYEFILSHYIKYGGNLDWIKTH